jgi:hypothetical protein
MKKQVILLSIVLMALAVSLLSMKANAILPTDLNKDGKVDMKDIYLCTLAFGCCNKIGRPADPRWNPICDINGDNLINAKDLALIAKDFGKSSS